jgi:hypothetical protein
MSKLGRSADSAAVGIVLRLEHPKSMRYTLRNLLVKLERAIGHSAKLPFSGPRLPRRERRLRRFLFAHGQPGGLAFSSALLSLDTLERKAGDLAVLGSAIGQGGELRL